VRSTLRESRARDHNDHELLGKSSSQSAVSDSLPPAKVARIVRYRFSYFCRPGTSGILDSCSTSWNGSERGGAGRRSPPRILVWTRIGRQ